MSGHPYALSEPEPAEEPAALPWQTAVELATDTPDKTDWAWRDYLALGSVVELDAKIKAGKTTFLGYLIRALLTGQPFLGRPTLSGPVTYLTEEGPRTFRAMLVRAGLIERADLHILSRRRVPNLTWVQLVEAAGQQMRETGSMVLVVDTLGSLAGFKDDEENSSGKAMEAMRPLKALATELDVAIILVRHDRKAGGEVGDSARGSSAFGGEVDVILQLSRVGGQGRERRRCLRAAGRFDELPPEITIELGKDGYREITEGDAVDSAAAALLALIPEGKEEAVALVDLLDDLKQDGHTRPIVYRAKDLLLEEERILKDKQPGPTGHKHLVFWRTSSHGGT